MPLAGGGGSSPKNLEGGVILGTYMDMYGFVVRDTLHAGTIFPIVSFPIIRSPNISSLG